MTDRILCLSIPPTEVGAIVALVRQWAAPDSSVSVLGPGLAPDPFPSTGADRVFGCRAPGFDAQRADHLSAAVVAAAGSSNAALILAGSSPLERETLARAAALLGGPCLTGVRSVKFGPEGAEVTRDFLSGNAIAVEGLSREPALLGLSSFPAPVPSVGSPRPPPETEWLDVELPRYPFRRLASTVKPAGGTTLESADRIVSVGRGLQRKEDLPLVQSLADALGAQIGCTRPLAADSRWMGEDHWVGLTGHRVRPTLYVALGISGAVQHLVGMRDSKVVVAVNRDPNAPIFQQADYQVVGDLYAVVPELVRRLRGPVTGSS